MGSNWKKQKLSELVSFSQGIQVSVEKQYKKTDPECSRFIRIIDFTNESEPIRYIKTPSKKYFVDKSDVIMIRYGSQTAGKVVRGKRGYIANNMFKITPLVDYIDQGYLYYALNDKAFYKYLISTQSSSTMPAISFGMLNSIEIYVPSILEQINIAKNLDVLNKKIELNQQTNQTLEQMAQTLFKSWFVDFDPVFDNLLAKVDFKLENLASDFPEALLKRAQKRLLALDDKAKTALLSANLSSEVKSPEETSSEEASHTNIHQHFPSEFKHNKQLGWIPKGWQVKELSQLVKHQKGFPFKSAWYQDEGHIVVRVSDTTDDSINVNSCNKISEELAAEYSSYALKENDLVIATVGSWPPNYSSVVGKVIRVPTTAEGGLLNQNAVKLTVSTEYSFHQGFLHFNLKNSRFMSYIINRAQGSANQASITLKSIFDFPMLIANDDVMRHFSDQVKFNFDKQNLNDEEIQSLTRLRDTLLPKLISGELQIPEVDL
jgi:type I restriction enzyme S subunit